MARERHAVQFHAGGKVALDHIYTQPDPRAYFGTLRELDYQHPAAGQATLRRLIHELPAPPGRPVTVVDIGCSYGINAALLRCDATMDELYERYCGADAVAMTRAEPARPRPRAGPGPRARTGPASSGSTSPATRSRTPGGRASSTTPCKPIWSDDEPDRRTSGRRWPRPTWSSRPVASGTSASARSPGSPRGRRRPPVDGPFVLRMYPFEPVAECLAGLGYDTVRVERAAPAAPVRLGGGAGPGAGHAGGARRRPARSGDRRLAVRAAVHLAPPAAQIATMKRMTRERPSGPTRTFGNEDRLPRVPLPTLARHVATGSSSGARRC